jgi:hypothetical protein
MEAVELIKLSHRVATRKQELLSIPFRNAANLFVKFGWLQGDRETPASGLGENKTGAGGPVCTVRATKFSLPIAA